MKVVHSQLRTADQPKAVKRISRREASARRWMELQQQRDYREAIKENMADILEIQKSEPGWMPTKENSL